MATTTKTAAKTDEKSEPSDTLAQTTAAAVLEIDRLGRLSDKTRATLAEALGERAKGLVVDIDDGQADDHSDKGA